MYFPQSQVESHRNTEFIEYIEYRVIIINAIVTIIIVVSNLSLLLFFCCLFFVLSLFFIEHYMFFVLSLFFIANCIYSTLHLHLQSGGSLFPGMVGGAIVAINDRHSNTSK